MIVSAGSGWSRQAGPRSDSWAGYLTERDDLFNFIRTEAISGVVLLSGDPHFPQVTCIPGSDQGGYDLYNLVSSALAQQVDFEYRPSFNISHFMGPEKLIRNPVFGVNNFGIIDFDLTDKVPELGFNVISAQGRPLYKPLVLLASDLQNGVKSWPHKMSV